MSDIPGKIDEGSFFGAALIKTTSGNVTVLNESVVVVNKTSGAATTVTLPANPRTGRTVFVQDGKGDAATNNITVAPASGNIAGNANYVINDNKGNAHFLYNGTEWAVQSSQGVVAFAGGAAQAITKVFKKVPIADNSATSVIRVTVPNANSAAVLRLTFCATVRNTGAFDSTRTALGMVVFDRVPGANVVGTAVALTNAGIATGGTATLTLAYSLTAASGAVGAVNTMDVQVTLVKTGGTDHQLVVLAELINAEASGITMAGL